MKRLKPAMPCCFKLFSTTKKEKMKIHTGKVVYNNFMVSDWDRKCEKIFIVKGTECIPQMNVLLKKL